jgi:hypothetical protein
MLLYPLAYAVVWSLPTGIRIYQSANGRPAPWQLQTVDKACIVLQGVVDAVIYGATESSLSSWRNLFFPGRFPPVVAGVPPAFGYGNASGTGGSSNKRWSSMRPGGEQQQQPVSRRTSGTRGGFWPTATTGSADSLGSSEDAGGTMGGSSEQIELATLEEGDDVERETGIRKTVKIEVKISSSSSSAGHMHDRQAALQRPKKAYLPEDSEGSYLDLS